MLWQNFVTVHGNWTEWSQWGDCSVTCENGTQARNRSCTNPEPKFDGDDCPDANVTVDIQGCHNAVMCPGKVYRQGVILLLPLLQGLER